MSIKISVKKTYYLIILLLPLLLVLSAILLNHSRGPYWLGSNSDPEYVYLLNAANLATLKGVGHIDHPGTPVQAIGAVVLRVVYAVSGEGGDGFQADVLKRPEFYLNAVNGFMLLLNVLVLVLIGVITFRLTGNIWWCLWLQLAPFFSPVLLEFGLTRVTPEPLLFFSSSVMVLLMVAVAHSAEIVKRKQFLMVMALGIVTGFGIACKITFIPMVMIPLAVVAGFKKKFYYLAAVAVGFVVFTLPIIRMYPRFFQWMFNLVGHSGKYGSGPSGMVDSSQYLSNAVKLLAGNPFFTLVLVVSLIVLAAALVWPEWRKVSLSNVFFRLLAGAAMAQVLGLVMVSKHSASHYLLPVLNLSGVMVFLLFFYLRHLVKEGGLAVSGRTLRFSFIAFIAVAALITNPLGGTGKTLKKLNRMKEKSLAVRHQLDTNYKDYAIIYYYRSSSPEYGLKFGSDLSRSYHAGVLEKLYPDVYFYDIWTRRFSNFDYNRAVSFEEIRAKHGDNIVFQGERGVKIKGVQLKEVTGKTSYEGIFICEK
ncbi:MAG: hypothetical protein GY940_08595 [bacterium]|nr:hypothetical protein [bacterium]